MADLRVLSAEDPADQTAAVRHHVPLQSRGVGEVRYVTGRCWKGIHSYSGKRGNLWIQCWSQVLHRSPEARWLPLQTAAVQVHRHTRQLGDSRRNGFLLPLVLKRSCDS